MAWNRPNEAAKPAPKKSPGVMRGAIAGAAVVVIAAVCFFIFSGEEEKPAPKVEKKPRVVEEVKPAPAPKLEKPKEEKPVRLTKKGTPIPDGVTMNEKGEYQYSNGQRWYDMKDVIHAPPPEKKRRLFKHSSENRIASILTFDPAHMLPFLVGKRKKFDQAFVDDFKASLNDTVVIDKEDTPEEAELRKAVLETKAELRERMEAGENIADIMNDYQHELDRLCQYNDEMRKMIRKAVDNPELSNEDVKDYVKAANQLLEKQGLKGLSMPNMATRQARLLMIQERRERAALKSQSVNKNKKNGE